MLQVTMLTFELAVGVSLRKVVAFIKSSNKKKQKIDKNLHKQINIEFTCIPRQW